MSCRTLLNVISKQKSLIFIWRYKAARTAGRGGNVI